MLVKPGQKAHVVYYYHEFFWESCTHFIVLELEKNKLILFSFWFFMRFNDREAHHFSMCMAMLHVRFQLFGRPQMKALLNVSGLTTPLSWIGFQTGWFYSIKEANLETDFSKVKHMARFFFGFYLKFIFLALVCWTPFQKQHLIRTCSRHHKLSPCGCNTIALPMHGQSMSKCGETWLIIHTQWIEMK